MPQDGAQREPSLGDEAPGSPGADATVATARTPGIDVARALAVLGMVIVNYKTKLGSGTRGPDWLVMLSDALDGRAAALFVVLAGMGISLRSRHARLDPARYLPFERRALIKRALVLFLAGLLNLHLWDWDILHCYGLFLALAVPLLNVKNWVLWLLAVASVVAAVVLQSTCDYYGGPEFWTLPGLPWNMVLTGLYPLFPWAAFLFVGMWLGRLDLNDDVFRRNLLIFALAIAGATELVDTVVGRAFEAGKVGAMAARWLNSAHIPPRPAYVIAATTTAITIVCSSIEVTRSRTHTPWVVALTATGQLAFTLYILHAIAIMVPTQHNLLLHASLAESTGYAFAFYGSAVAFSLWWRRRYAYGPLELFIRQITGRVAPAPWGGELVRSTKE